MPSPDCLTGPSYHHRHHIRKYYHIIISNLVLETGLNICQGLHQSSSSSSSASPTSRSHLEGVEAGGGEAAEVESCFCCCTQLRFVRIWNFAKISSALQKAHSWSVVDDERYSPIHLRPASPTARAQCKELQLQEDIIIFRNSQGAHITLVRAPEGICYPWQCMNVAKLQTSTLLPDILVSSNSS